MRRPNFGTLAQDERSFTFAHDAQLLHLTNGLEVALVHDDRTNVVTIDLRYAVGAAEDPVGRTGMAHLVEHLLFELRKTPSEPTLGETLGELALYSNAWTTWDATHFTTHVSGEHLAAAFELEARRMDARCDQLDEATFLRERDVVRAEGRQSASPFTTAMLAMLTDVYGSKHPYTRAITTDEIAASTRDEVCTFLERYYAPDRAYLVVTGPFDPATVRAQLARSFGPIRRRASAPRAVIDAPRLEGGTSTYGAPVTRPTALVLFRFPAWGEDGIVKYLVARDALEDGLASADRDRPWITRTSVYINGGDRARVLIAAVEVDNASHLSDAADEVFRQTERLLDGQTAPELGNGLLRMAAQYVASWDDLPSRGQWISELLQYTNHDELMLREMRAIFDTPWVVAVAQLRGALTRDRSHVFLLTPGMRAGSTFASAIPAGSHDLTPWRAPVDPAEADQPIALDAAAATSAVPVYTLANGLRVELAPDPKSPIIDARLVFPVGRAHEPADKPFLATAAARLLVPFAGERYRPATYNKLSWAMSRGTETAEWIDETSTVFAVRGLAVWGDWHVWNLAQLVDQGRYSDEMIGALRRAALARGDTEEDDIDPAAAVFRARLFGDDHPYARPEPDRRAAFLRLTADDLSRWRDDHFRVKGATLVVSGAFDAPKMKREIEELFGPLPATSPAPVATIAPARAPQRASWIAVDDPGAMQTSIFVGFPSSSATDADEAARVVLQEMLEDALRDVREGMGASYGLHASYVGGVAGSALLIQGEVEDAHAGVSLAHILASLKAIQASGDTERSAFVRARKKALALALGRAAGASAVASELATDAAHDWTPSHRATLAAAVARLTLADVMRVASTDLNDTQRVVLVRGARQAVDAAFAEVGVVPERPLPTIDADVDIDDAPDADAPVVSASTDAPTPSRGRHREPGGPRLSVGAPDGQLATNELGLFLGANRLTLDEFLEVAGADEVKRRMRRRVRIRQVATVAGLVGMLASGATLASTRGDCGDGSDHECTGRLGSKRNALYAAFGGSLTVTAIAVLAGRGSPSNDELRAIAARYNRVSVAPGVTDGAAGVTVSGRF